MPALLRGGKRLFVGKGRQFQLIELGRTLKPAELALALGPSGNLRAPAARVGSDWLVGFNAEAWDEVLG